MPDAAQMLLNDVTVAGVQVAAAELALVKGHGKTGIRTGFTLQVGNAINAEGAALRGVETVAAEERTLLNDGRSGNEAGEESNEDG